MKRATSTILVAGAAAGLLYLFLRKGQKPGDEIITQEEYREAMTPFPWMLPENVPAELAEKWGESYASWSSTHPGEAAVLEEALGKDIIQEALPDLWAWANTPMDAGPVLSGPPLPRGPRRCSNGYTILMST